VERSKFKKSEKMMRKNVAAGEEVQNQNIRKNDEKRRCRRWILKIRKNDEKRRFRRSKVKVPKIRKNDEKRRFRRWISKIPKKK
jgi:hypothetical protein